MKRRVFPCWFASLIVLLILCPVTAATNSAWFARTWHTGDGLPAHTIVGLEQTPDGYLWIATHRSLSRFDGLRFQEFAPATPESPTAGQIRALILDRRGRLWLAKDGGVISFIEDGVMTQAAVLGETVPGAQFREMVEDAQGRIWINDSAGSVFRIQDGKVQAFSTAQGLRGQNVCRLTTDLQGRLWFSQAGNVGVFRDGRFETLLTLGQQSAFIAPARHGGIWLCSGETLYHVQPDGKIQEMAELPPGPGGVDAGMTALYEDTGRALWIGTTTSGLFRFDFQGLESVPVAHPNILDIVEDSEGNLWVATRGGLNRLSPRVLQLLGPETGLPFTAVRSACEDTAGTLWVVGQAGALACLSNGVWSLVSSNAGWSGAEAVCVTAKSDGSVLIGTVNQGVIRHQGGVFGPVMGNSQLPEAEIRSLFACANGDLWAAIGSEVIRLGAQDGKATGFPLPTGASPVRTMVEDQAGDLWLGTTSDGLLLRVHDDRLINETTNVMQGPKHIRCLQVTKDGALWMGFVGYGLGRLKQDRFFEYRMEQGLGDDFVSQILPDDSGRLWIGCNRGIFHVSQSELEAVAEGRASRFRSVAFGRGQGVPNLQASFGITPGAARTRDGRLLMPMLTGLAVIQPGLLAETPLPPPVIIERLIVNGQAAATYDDSGRRNQMKEPAPANLRMLRSALGLGPGVHRLDVEFNGLSLSSPENVTFRYQLVGVDEDWLEAGPARVARYPGIPPGDYRFRVTACDQDGVWNETGAVVLLKVAPFFWETLWFRSAGTAGAIGLLSGGVVLVVRRRYRRRLGRLKQQQALERERARIAQDLHDDLGSGLVEINFGSELAQDPALNAEDVREHTREIGVRAREMVTALDEIVWAVNPKHDSVSSLATYFCQFAQHFLKATPVRCHLDVARNLPVAPLNSEQRHSLFLAFKEALSNVVQHANATDLRLSIATPESTLTIGVRDDGCGMSLIEPRERSGADGLGNMRRRLQRLGGRCELTSRPGEGATVTFKVPLPGRGAARPDNSVEVL